MEEPVEEIAGGRGECKNTAKGQTRRPEVSDDVVALPRAYPRPSVLLLFILLAGLLSPRPSLGQTAGVLPRLNVHTVPAQVYVKGQAIDSLTLPAATGDGTLTYTLKGPNATDANPDLPEGLMFHGPTRTLTDTPTAVQDRLTYTYTVTDTDGDFAYLLFDITVRQAGVRLTASPAIIPENAGATQVTITATLDASASTETTVALSVDSASVGDLTTDYTLIPSPLPTITIQAGDLTATATATVTPIVDDTTYTVGRTLVLTGASSRSLPVFPATLRLPEADNLVVTTVADTVADAFKADYYGTGEEHLDMYNDDLHLCDDIEAILTTLTAPIRVSATALSLREAILLANFNYGADTIRFAASIATQADEADRTITLAFDGPDTDTDPDNPDPDNLPPLCAGALTIDGPLDNTGQPTITLDGKNVVGNDRVLGTAAGFYVITDAKTIRGLRIKNFDYGILSVSRSWKDAWTQPTIIAHNVITHDSAIGNSPRSGITVQSWAGERYISRHDGRAPSTLSNLTIEHNTVELAQYGMDIEHNGGDGRRLSNILISHNTVQDNLQIGIFVDPYVALPEERGFSIDGLTIQSNTLQRNYIDILLQPFGASNTVWTNIRVVNNTISAGGVVGILVRGYTSDYQPAFNNDMNVTLEGNEVTGKSLGIGIWDAHSGDLTPAPNITDQARDNHLTVTLNDNTVEDATYGLHVIGGRVTNADGKSQDTTQNTVTLQGSSTTFSRSSRADLYVRGGVDASLPYTSTDNAVMIADSFAPVLCGAASVDIGPGDPGNTVDLTLPFCDGPTHVDALPDLAYTAGTGKLALTLPEALDVDPTTTGDIPTYELTPDLPAGLFFAPVPHTLTGTPTSVQVPREYTYTATGEHGNTGSLTFRLGVAAPLSVETIPPQTYTQGQTVSLTPPVAGGAPSKRYTINPALPPELMLNPDSGEITGTPTGTPTQLTYTITVTDENGATATLDFQLSVAARPSFVETTIAEQTYTQDEIITLLTLPEATGGVGTLVYTLEGPSATPGNPDLPAGLAFEKGSRELTGTPTDAWGEWRTYTYTVTDDNNVATILTFNLGVFAPLSFGDATIAEQNYTQGRAITPLTLPAATGGVPPLTYTLEGPNPTPGNPDLPAGLMFDAGPPGTLTGTPTGTLTQSTYTYTVTDRDGATDTLDFFLTVAARPSRPRPPSPPSRPRPGGGDGDDDDEGDVTPSPFFFENPAPDSFQSGLGVISGWVCDADTVEIVFEQGTTGAAETLPAAYGTSRQDTVSACGHPDTGFGLLWNWNLLGDGAHTVRLVVDGTAVAHRAITVTTLGVEFREGVSGECTVDDFPTAAATTALHWSESLQNFVIGTGGRGTDGSGGGSRGAAARFFFENPAPGSAQSGLGIISGWVCDADTVEIVFEHGTTGEAHPLPAAYGTSRQDTVSACGHPDTGFGLLWNWNILGDGDHTVRLVVDGTAVAWSAVTVTTLGVEFREGGSGECTVDDFPEEAATTALHWSESLQNFVITDREE